MGDTNLQISGIVKDGVTDDHDKPVDVSEDEQATLEGQQIIWNSIFAFASSMALKAAILLDIPDILAKAGPEATLSVEEIAAKLSSKAPGPNVDFLRRILRFLAANKIISQTAVQSPSTGPGIQEWRYGLTNASRLLVKENNEFCLAPMALMLLHKVNQMAWHFCHECVLEGGTGAFERANGKDLYNYAKEFPDFNNLFNEAMAANSEMPTSVFLKHYDGLKDIKSLVDVGGGLGVTSSKIASAYPHIKCINFDLPHVIASASSIPGVEHIAGDMFESVPSADAIFMKLILHNWSDDRCTKILRNCYRALPKNGKVIIIDTVLDISEKTNPFSYAEFSLDLAMLVLLSEGLERSKDEWHNLLTRVGFLNYNITGVPMGISIIEAYKL